MARNSEDVVTRVLATFPRRTDEEARVTFIQEGGKEARVDFRIWWRPPDGEGEELRPTKKGVRFPISDVPGLMAALRLAQEEFKPSEPPVRESEAPF